MSDRLRTSSIGLFIFIIFYSLTDCGDCFSLNKNYDTNSHKLFIENKGQILDQNSKPNPKVLYLLNTPGMNVQLRKGGFSYDVYSIEKSKVKGNVIASAAKQQKSKLQLKNQNPHDYIFSQLTTHDSQFTTFHRIDINLEGTNPECKIIPSDPFLDYLNYYNAHTPDTGITNVRQYKNITYKNIYSNIDLEFVTNEEHEYKYNFVLHPGANINDIRLMIAGTEDISLNQDTLKFRTRFGYVEELIPESYLQVNDAKVDVKARFHKINDGIYGFSIDKIIPENSTLIIDPTSIRLWGTYYGGSGNEWGYCLAVDSIHNAYVTGTTGSANNIATAGAYQTTKRGPFDNGFLAKFNANGVRQWGTYYGGDSTGTVEIHGCATDISGNIYIVGYTNADSGIVTPGAHQTIFGGGNFDAFLAKFNTNGERLWATYYGGELEDEINGPGVTTNKYGSVYICGSTESTFNIGTPGAYQETLNSTQDAFLVKFDSNGVRQWGTYYGGEFADFGYACTTDTAGNVYFAGSTSSHNNIASPGAFQTTYGGGFEDAFLVAFTSSGQRIWGTYFGGNFEEVATICTVDYNGFPYLGGWTSSTTGIASTGCYQPILGGGTDGFIAKFSTFGQRTWSSYYGGNLGDWIEGCSISNNGDVFYTGITQSLNGIATPYSFMPVYRGGFRDAFLVKFDSSGQRQWGTYFGDLGDDRSTFCTYLPDDTVYFTGVSTSINNIATPNSHQTILGGNYDAILEKFLECWPIDTAGPITGLVSVCESTTGVSYSIPPLAHTVNYIWTLPPGVTISNGAGTTSIIANFSSSASSGNICVKGLNKCGDPGDSAFLYVTVHQRPVPVISGNDTTCTGPDKIYSTAPGKTNYQWSVSSGGVITGGGSTTNNSVTVSWNSPGLQTVQVNYTDTDGCAALTPTQFNVFVIPGPPVSISINASANNVCVGTSVNFTAVPTNGGNGPHYQWKVNGVNAGINSSTYSYTPLNGDVVFCILTSYDTCSSNNPATSNSITMVVNPLLPVAVNIISSVNPCCAGTSVTFTATPTNGGSSPTYQWKVNGLNVGTNSLTYTYTPANGDLVKCVLTSSEVCTTNNPAMSNQILMVVNSNLLVSITISASVNPVCGGIPVTFTATPTNGGSPPQYQWKVNGNNVGTNSPNYTYIPSSGDQVSCILTSNLNCTSNNPATSNILSMTINSPPIVTFTRCFDSITITNAKPIKLKGGIPLGGTYSGPGVSNGYFYPNLAGTGTKTITYSYTNSALCSASAHISLFTFNFSLFTCGNNLTDIRDSKVYPTVQIGSQCWMAANLNYGIEIPSTQNQRDNCIPEKYKSAVSSQQSAFYQWDELMRYDDTPGLQGLCPPGWHVPMEAEWNTLFTNWTNNAFAGAPLKYSGYSGFNAFLTGARFMNKTWSFDDFATYFWSSTSHGPLKAWAHAMNDYDPSVTVYPSWRSNAFSVRCLQD